MAKKDPTPPEIAAARKRRERHDVKTGFALWLTWLGLFIAGLMVHGALGFWLGNVAFAACMASLAVAYREQALRKITGRPRADYAKIRKLQRADREARSSSKPISSV